MTVVTEKNPELGEELRVSIAHAVGVGAVKYFDLRGIGLGIMCLIGTRCWRWMGIPPLICNMPHARVRSIFRKAGDAKIGAIAPQSPHELMLAKHILRFGEVIELVGRELKPHHLCGYLYDLATKFSGFYENCPVLQSEEPTRGSRLGLCDLTARTLEKGLDLLGIMHPDQM